MRKINVRKRGNVYEYFFEGAKVNNKRKRITKSGFRTKAEAYESGLRAYEEYSNGGIKRELGRYKLCDITPFLLNKTLLGLYQKTQTKETLRNYQKVIKSSLRDATYYFGFIEGDPAGSLQIPKILSFESKKTMPNMCIQ